MRQHGSKYLASRSPDPGEGGGGGQKDKNSTFFSEHGHVAYLI